MTIVYIYIFIKHFSQLASERNLWSKYSNLFVGCFFFVFCFFFICLLSNMFCFFYYYFFFFCIFCIFVFSYFPARMVFRLLFRIFLGRMRPHPGHETWKAIQCEGSDRFAFIQDRKNQEVKTWKKEKGETKLIECSN